MRARFMELRADPRSSGPEAARLASGVRFVSYTTWKWVLPEREASGVGTAPARLANRLLSPALLADLEQFLLQRVAFVDADDALVPETLDPLQIGFQIDLGQRPAQELRLLRVAFVDGEGAPVPELMHGAELLLQLGHRLAFVRG